MIDRRSVLRWIVAVGTLGGLAALIARRPNPAAGANCSRDRHCRRCPSADGCVQPEALSWRAVRKDA